MIALEGSPVAGWLTSLTWRLQIAQTTTHDIYHHRKHHRSLTAHPETQGGPDVPASYITLHKRQTAANHLRQLGAAVLVGLCPGRSSRLDSVECTVRKSSAQSSLHRGGKSSGELTLETHFVRRSIPGPERRPRVK